MTVLFEIKPEVSGNVEPPIDYRLRECLEVYDRSGLATIANQHIEYIFDFLPHDDIQTALGCYIVSCAFAEAIRDNNISGARFGTVNVFRSDVFEELHGICELPEYEWLLPLGRVVIGEAGIVTEWSSDDLSYSVDDLALVGTARVVEVMQRFHVSNTRFVRLQRQV